MNIQKVDQFPIWIIATAREEGTLTTLDYVVPNPAARVRKLLSNIRSNDTSFLASIASVQTSMTLRNYFEQTVDTLQSEIRATKITTTWKQSIYALKGGRGGRGGNGRGVRGSSDKHVRLNDQGNRPHGIDWVEDKFYEQGFYEKFSAEQNTRLHVRAN